MFCLFCNSATEVTNSRHRQKSNTVWRRRKCNVCQSIFTSYESFDIGAVIKVQNSNGTSRPFSRDKLFISVYEACRHRKTALGDATGLTDTIIALVANHKTDGIIKQSDLVSGTLKVLKRFDTVASTYYKAYHGNK